MDALSFCMQPYRTNNPLYVLKTCFLKKQKAPQLGMPYALSKHHTDRFYCLVMPSSVITSRRSAEQPIPGWYSAQTVELAKRNGSCRME